ncbi:MAG: RNA polymerase factor sigma-54 [Candidatus Omnitrophota bacterium]
MKHKFSQNQKQQQKMALTPQMRQSIELLAMPMKELGEYVDSILEKNPFLKKAIEKKNYRPTGEIGSEPQITSNVDPRLALLSQLRMSKLDEDRMRIAEYLIYEINDNGYISCDMDEAASDLGADIETVENVLDIIQQMEPAGIGARDAQECLLLQLKRLGKESSTEYKIVQDYIHELTSHDAQRIAQALKIGEDDVLKAFKSIRKLNPKPASTLLSEKIDLVIPDLVAHIKKDKVTIRINRDWFPVIRFYNPYENKPDMIKDPEVREFVKVNESAAKQLLDSLKRREDTMCRVASYILNFQLASLKSGKSGSIRTIAIKDVAAALGFHSSTISRTISNKYIQLDKKVLALNSLLSSGIKKADGQVISKSYILDRLSSIIKNEDKSKPLRDDAIHDLLSKEGILIKRRTVAKYRNALRILPKHLRKKA